MSLTWKEVSPQSSTNPHLHPLEDYYQYPYNVLHDLPHPELISSSRRISAPTALGVLLHASLCIAPNTYTQQLSVLLFLVSPTLKTS